MNSKTQREQVTLRLPKDLNKQLLELAAKTGIAKNALIVTACWQFIKKENR